VEGGGLDPNHQPQTAIEKEQLPLHDRLWMDANDIHGKEVLACDPSLVTDDRIDWSLFEFHHTRQAASSCYFLVKMTDNSGEKGESLSGTMMMNVAVCSCEYLHTISAGAVHASDTGPQLKIT